jgi:hypothetical protein
MISRYAVGEKLEEGNNMKQTKLLIVKFTLVENHNILFGVLDDLCFIGRLV